MKRLPFLFKKYLDNQITPDEFSEFWQLLEQEGLSDNLTPELRELWEMHPEYSKSNAEWDQKMKIFKNAQQPAIKKVRVWRYVSAAAVLLLIIGAYWLVNWQTGNLPKQYVKQQLINEVKPGRSGAILTLSNGQKIVLDSAGEGETIKDADLGILKKGGEIIYTGKTNEVVYNTVTTDKGRQWRLTLPDGSKVWLNAVSSIHYPLSFTGSERLVEVTGEAFFEVVHDAKKPFKVKVGNHIIEDIGTSFNVNAYHDESDIKTTLIEGLVSIASSDKKFSSVLLKPGQQALINPAGNIKINKDADTDEVISWKNGLFNFNQSSIENIMRQIGRWYDLDVKYSGKISNETFSGIVSRNSNLSLVLKIMEQASIKFKIEGKIITVMN